MKARIVSDGEGLRIAAEMEKRGIAFYSHAARIAKSEPVIALLNRLTADEQDHYEEFLRLYEQFTANASEDARYDEESTAILSAIASDIVFPGGLMALGREGGFDDPVKILLQGIQSEKDSILYYAEMVRRAGDEAVRDAFRAIIRQEVGHLRELTAELESYT